MLKESTLKKFSKFENIKNSCENYYFFNLKSKLHKYRWIIIILKNLHVFVCVRIYTNPSFVSLIYLFFLKTKKMKLVVISYEN